MQPTDAGVKRRRILLGSLAAVLVLLGIAAIAPRGDAMPPGETALFSSLPILWPETDDPGLLLRADAPPHWARTVLEARGGLRPLDTLAVMPAGPDLLVMAQPRPLSPQENVAVDGWLRAGGRVLLFADPALTRHSAYAIGDRRRPQDLVLISPILARWGLQLSFAADQPAGDRLAPLLGLQVPVNLAGRFAPVPGSTGCAIADDGLVARCRLGRGWLVAVADAAVLEEGDGQGADLALRRAALSRLMATALED